MHNFYYSEICVLPLSQLIQTEKRHREKYNIEDNQHLKNLREETLPLTQKK